MIWALNITSSSILTITVKLTAGEVHMMARVGLELADQNGSAKQNFLS